MKKLLTAILLLALLVSSLCLSSCDSKEEKAEETEAPAETKMETDAETSAPETSAETSAPETKAETIAETTAAPETEDDSTEPASYHLEGETDLLYNAYGTSTVLDEQIIGGLGWSGDGQIYLYHDSEQATLQIDLDFKKAGTYHLSGVFTKAADYGIYTLFVNDTEITTIDTYDAGLLVSEIDFGEVTLKAGTNLIEFRCAGKNEASAGFCIGIDYLDFVQQ